MKDRALRESYRAMSCEACGRRGCDPCHVRTYAVTGLDEEWNMIPLCRLHHVEQHQIGWHKFSHKYIGVAAALLKRGWDFEMGKLVRIEIQQGDE